MNRESWIFLYIHGRYHVKGSQLPVLPSGKEILVVKVEEWTSFNKYQRQFNPCPPPGPARDGALRTSLEHDRSYWLQGLQGKDAPRGTYKAQGDLHALYSHSPCLGRPIDCLPDALKTFRSTNQVPIRCLSQVAPGVSRPVRLGLPRLLAAYD